MNIFQKTITLSFVLVAVLFSFGAWKNGSFKAGIEQVTTPTQNGHYLYVATPGIRNYLGYGGHGIVVFDIDNGHKFVKRIPTHGFKADGTPSNVKGVAVSKSLNSIYISFPRVS